MYTAILLLVGLGCVGLTILLRDIIPMLWIDRRSQRLQREEVARQRRAQGIDERPKLPAIGSTGRVATRLRPVGTVGIAGQTWEASAESSVIDAATDIQVVDHRGRTLVVRPIDHPPE